MEKFPLPSKIEVKKGQENGKVFIFEPLYPGYGNTIGNALRRVLLSSLPGAAVQAVKIKGVDHEFSSISHVKEDVVTIILNLKKLKFNFHGEEPVKVNLHVKGEKAVTAGDIKTKSDVEVVSKKLHIATLTGKDSELDMELTIGSGRGYVTVETREDEQLDIGTIAIDSIYTPVKNVNFDIENVRVAQMTNYERLILNVSTDGTITPEEALKMASVILVEHFNFVKNLKSKVEKSDKEKEDKPLAPIKDESDKEKEEKEESKEEKSEPKKEDSEEGGETKEKKKRGRPKKTESTA